MPSLKLRSLYSRHPLLRRLSGHNLFNVTAANIRVNLVPKLTRVGETLRKFLAHAIKEPRVGKVSFSVLQLQVPTPFTDDSLQNLKSQIMSSFPILSSNYIKYPEQLFVFKHKQH